MKSLYEMKKMSTFHFLKKGLMMVWLGWAAKENECMVRWMLTCCGCSLNSGKIH